MTTPEGFHVRALQVMRAHFNQPSGPSRPGAEWVIALTNSAGERQVLVRTYADEIGERSPAQEAELAVDYVGYLIQTGWTPDQYRDEPGELVVPKGFVGS